ncbi:MAG: TRAP transporter substrate-binding protein DctP [Burkholderiales bacterium]
MNGLTSRNWFLAVFSVLTSLCISQASATDWKMHAVWGEQRPEVSWLRGWSDRIRERTKGSLNITVYPGGSLGINDADVLRTLPQGNLYQATLLYNGYVSRDSKPLALSYVVGSITSENDMLKLMPALDDIYAKTFAKWGIKYLGTIITPDASVTIFCKEPFSSLDDLKKRKLRTWGAFDSDVFRKLGIASSVIPQKDLYLALQTGVVDCAQYWPSAALTVSLQEVAPYYSELSANAPPLALIVSQTAWDALTAEQKEVVSSETVQLKEQITSEFLAQRKQAEGRTAYNAKGGKQQQPFSAADQRRYSMAVQEAWKDESIKAGKDVLENFEQLQTSLKATK